MEIYAQVCLWKGQKKYWEYNWQNIARYHPWFHQHFTKTWVEWVCVSVGRGGKIFEKHSPLMHNGHPLIELSWKGALIFINSFLLEVNYGEEITFNQLFTLGMVNCYVTHFLANSRPPPPLITLSIGKKYGFMWGHNKME